MKNIILNSIDQHTLPYEFGFYLVECEELQRVDAHPLDEQYVKDIIGMLEEDGYTLNIVRDRETYEEYVKIYPDMKKSKNNLVEQN